MMEFKHSFLRGTSLKLSDPNECDHDYDLVFLFSSWDSRSTILSAARSTLLGKSVVVCLWDQKDDKGLREKHDDTIKEALSAAKCQTIIIEGKSTDLIGISSKLRSEIRHAFGRLGRPVKILIDISATPRYYILDLFSFSFASSLVASAHFFYSEAEYIPTGSDTGAINVIFTGNDWTLTELPLLKSDANSSANTSVLISMGFETNKILRCLKNIDPDNVLVLYSALGGSDANVSYAKRLIADMQEKCGIPPSNIIPSHASDAVATWKDIISIESKPPLNGNSYISICGGLKPHCLALAAASVTTKRASIYYNKPDSHRVHVTRPSGVYWLYKFRDLTALV